MSQFRYNIECRLLTLNDYIQIERGNKFMAAKEKKRYTEICSLYAMSGINTVLKGLYDVKIIWNVETNKHDADNVYFACKFILDGLVHSKRLVADGRKNIRHISHEIYTKEKYNVEVILTEVC